MRRPGHFLSAGLTRYDAGSELGAGYMRRREFFALTSGVLAWPFATRAQPAKLPTVGLLGSGTLSTWSGLTAAFVQRLHELGWIEGRTIAIENRWAEGRSERYTEIGAEFVRLKVDVIVTVGTAVPALKQLTSAIPIVFAAAYRTRAWSSLCLRRQRA